MHTEVLLIVTDVPYLSREQNVQRNGHRQRRPVTESDFGNGTRGQGQQGRLWGLARDPADYRLQKGWI